MLSCELSTFCFFKLNVDYNLVLISCSSIILVKFAEGEGGRNTVNEDPFLEKRSYLF